MGSNLMFFKHSIFFLYSVTFFVVFLFIKKIEVNSKICCISYQFLAKKVGEVTAIEFVFETSFV